MNSIVDFHQNMMPKYQQVDTRFDAEYGVVWAIMKPEPRPCYNPTCLSELLQHQKYIHNNQGRVAHNGELKKVNYFVLSSVSEEVFCLGGDLSLFKQFIVDQNKEGLREYSRLCIDNLWLFYEPLSPITTISMVRGQAMGGGFEAALSAHVIVAEKSASMGFPEVIFNLFPGMGALSFLSRRVGMQMAEKMVRSGKVYSGEELYQMGVVDVLAEDGQAEYALQNWIHKNNRSINSYQAINKAKQRVNPLTYQELSDITDIWVDAAMNLDERNLKIMERLVKAQNAKVTTEASPMADKQIA